MKLMNKRIISLLLALAMLLGMMPMQVFATEGTQETEAVEVVTEPTETPKEETTAPVEETEPSEEEEEAEPSGEEEETESPDEEEDAEPSEPSESEEEPEVIHEHDYEAVVTDPTCTEKGYTTYTCECGDSYVSDYLDATDHTYKNGICTVCGEEDYDGLDLNGLNVLCLGDSITAGQGLTTATRWTNVLASKYGWTLTNKSQGGISLSSYYYTANGTTDYSIAKKAEVLKTMTTKPDAIIVWGGHNDTSYRASPLGTWDDETTNSFKGALKRIAELAAEYAPDATLFVLTPLWTTEAPSTLKVPENTTDNNWMFVDAIYDGAEAYGWIPINMDLCGITPFTKSGLLLDSIHPNEAGTEKIVEYLSEELACYGANSKKETIIFNKPAVSMKTGESTTLKAVQSPRSGNGSPVFTWSSSDSSVATVDASGKITAVAPGTAVITATAPNGISADISVSVVCEHTYEPSVTAPTCTEQGYTTYTCACGDSYVDDHVDATDHTYKSGICTVCGMEHPNLANYEGKVISIMGDSISSFKGYIPVADGFNEEHLHAYPARDVQSWDKTWWGLVINSLDAKLGINDSWSGSRVHNYSTADNPGGNIGVKVCMSSITRVSNLGANGTPDIIFVYGGTNDGKFSPFGGFDPSRDYSQVDLDAVTWKTFEDAYVAMIQRMQHYYPEAKIIALLPTPVASWYTDEKLATMNSSIKEICNYFGVDYVDLPECGITLADLPDGLHPNAAGMSYIADAVLEVLLNTPEEAGENIVHSITHILNGATASKGHYKGVSNNKSFEEKLTGELECVSVTMNGLDITKTCYENGTICIQSVNGDVIVTEKDHSYENSICTGCGEAQPGPIITQQPESVQQEIGKKFAITVKAEGEGLRYQWYVKESGAKAFKLSVNKTASYAYTMQNYMHKRQVYCVITDINGNSVQTEIATITRPPMELKLLAQPEDVCVEIGQKFSVKPAVQGDDLTYQWYYKESYMKEFAVSSNKTPAYAYTMQTYMHNRTVYCVITDKDGNSVRTEPATITRPPMELKLLTQPEDVYAEKGEKFSIKPNVQGDGLTYQWYYKESYQKKFSASSNKSSAYAYAMQSYMNGRSVYCVITDQYGNQVQTEAVTIHLK